MTSEIKRGEIWTLPDGRDVLVVSLIGLDEAYGAVLAIVLHPPGRYPDTAMSVVIDTPIDCTAVAVNLQQLRTARFTDATRRGDVGPDVMARVDQALRGGLAIPGDVVVDGLVVVRGAGAPVEHLLAGQVLEDQLLAVIDVHDLRGRGDGGQPGREPHDRGHRRSRDLVLGLRGRGFGTGLSCDGLPGAVQVPLVRFHPCLRSVRRSDWWLREPPPRGRAGPTARPRTLLPPAWRAGYEGRSSYSAPSMTPWTATQ